MKLAIQYARDGAAKYISHLDMQRAFARAIRRADIDAQYSQGFNPHIVMSFASPLSVGYATQADYLEVGVQEGVRPGAAMDALNAALPRDIRVRDAFFLPEGGKKLMAMNHSADWRLTFTLENERKCDTINHAVKVLGNSETYFTPDRKGREVDIAPLVLRLDDMGNGCVEARLQNSSMGALNPAVLANALLREAGLEAGWEVCRMECYALANGEVLPFSALREERAETAEAAK